MSEKLTYAKSIDWIFEDHPKDDFHSQILDYIINHLLVDVKETVSRTVRSWNIKTRDTIRAQTGLTLQYKTKELVQDLFGKRHHQSYNHSVSIKTTEMVPPAFFDIIEKHPPIIWELAMVKSNILRSLEGINKVEKLHNDLKRASIIDGNSDVKKYLEVGVELGQIINKLNDLDIADEIRRIPGDIFGSYNFIKHEVNIHWITIGAYALIKDLPVEDVTLVILAHELAHAYTHLGFDIDGNGWQTEDFAKAELPIVEGIAEYYAQQFCQTHASYRPNLPYTFNKLQENAPFYYHQYIEWFDDVNQDIGEAVRYAIISARATHEHSYDRFKNLIETGKKMYSLK